MPSRQQKNGPAPIIILSDSDSDAPEPAPQRRGEQRKRSSTAAGGNAPKGARLIRCEDCKTLWPVQSDQTPSNSGRNVILQLLSLPLAILSSYSLESVTVETQNRKFNFCLQFIHCEICKDIQWVSSNQSSQPRPPEIESDDDIVFTGSKPAPSRLSSPDVVFISTSLAAPSRASRPPPTVPQNLVLPSASEPLRCSPSAAIAKQNVTTFHIERDFRRCRP
jgi:hypothetical protein